MVRRPLLMAPLILAAAVAAGEALAVDWGRAGGGLFVETTGAVPEVSAPLRVGEPGQPFAEAVAAAAGRHGLDPKLLHALVLVESRYRPDAVSRAGAAGLTQLMPGTAREIGVADRFDPAQSLAGGADYLAKQIVRFGDLRLALAAYNAGPSRVARLGRVPELAETRAYVAAVVDCYLALTAGRTLRSSADCRTGGPG